MKKNDFKDLFVFLFAVCISFASCGDKSGGSDDPPYIPPRGQTYWEDGEVVVVQKATKAQALNVVVVGDGFIKEDLRVNGVYEALAKQNLEIFLRLPVFRDMKEYMNIYILMCESKERGMWHPSDNSYSSEVHVDNKFHSHNGSYDYDLVKTTVRSMKEIGSAIEQTGVIFIANGYLGGYAMGGGYGFGIASFPVATDVSASGHISGYWAIHEFGGHILGGLPDQYGSGPISQSVKDNIDREHAEGRSLATDYTNDPEKVIWKEFLKQEMYQGIVGIYPGGYNGTGESIYMPEEKSCMRENPYFCYDAPSRYQIWKRMKMIAQEGYTLSEFFKYDVVNIPRPDCSHDPTN